MPEVAPEVRDLSRRLLPDATRLGHRMAERILAEIPLYAAGDAVSLEDLYASCADNMRYVLGELAGEPSVTLEAPRATGAARAEAGVPYAAVLSAFRIGGRFVWELLVEQASPEAHDALLRAAADIWSVSDDLATHVTDAYRAASAERARRDAQLRAAIVGTVLDGEMTADADLWATAAALPFDRDGRFVVVTALCRPPGTEALPRAERVLAGRGLDSAWRMEHDHQDGVVALRRDADESLLVELLAPLAVGRVGVSAPFDGLDQAPAARRQAGIACGAAPSGVTRYDPGALDLVLASTPEQSAVFARAVLDGVLGLPSDDREVLLATARAWIDADGSTATAAEQLHVHRNTVRYRLGRLQDLTGRDVARPSQLTELDVALRAARMLDLG